MNVGRKMFSHHPGALLIPVTYTQVVQRDRYIAIHFVGSLDILRAKVCFFFDVSK